MFKRRKNLEEYHATLLNSNATSKEKEDIVLSLLNDSSEEVYPILVDYLKLDNESNPINPIFNYRGEFISGIKTLLVSKVARGGSEESKKFIFHLLGKYYLFPDMRNALLTTLTNEFKARDQALSVIFTMASQENIPTKVYIDLLTEYADHLPEKSKISFLMNAILTPDFISSDFPSNFNQSVVSMVISLKSLPEALFITLQSMADKCTRPNINFYQKDYLTPYHDALTFVSGHSDLLEGHERKDEIISYLKKILSSVGQSEDEQFLLSYNETKISSDRFISFWHNCIETRSRLRNELLTLLVLLRDESAQHEMTLLEFRKKFADLEEIKTVYKEIGEITDFSDLKNVNEFIFKLEILLEILEWSFIEILETNDYTKFDIIKAIMVRVNTLVQRQHPDAKTQHILDLLKTTTEEAINQYLFRQSVVQKVIKSEEFLLKLQQREVKYLKMEMEPIHQLNMRFKNVRDLADKQKKRFNQLIGNFNAELIMDFLTKLNDVVSRIANLPHYYVMFKPRLRVYNANYAKKDNKLILDDLQDRLSIFYRSFEAMISSTLQLPISILAFRRMDAIIDLINDFLSYNGLVDFEVEYFTAQV